MTWRGRSHGGLDLGIGDLGRVVSYQMVPDWAVQRPPPGRRCPGRRRSATGGGEADDVGVVVGARHVLGHTIRRSWTARDDVDGAALEGGDEESQAVKYTNQPASQMRWAIITS